MEKHIELINAYLNKSLNESDSLAFENKLKTDNEFDLLYQEHIVFLEGLKRVSLKQEIQSAYKSHLRVKWIKNISIITGVVVVSVLMYSLLTNKPEIQIEKTPKIENNTIITSDSIETKKLDATQKTKNDVKVEKIVLEKKDLEKDSNQTIQKLTKNPKKEVVESKTIQQSEKKSPVVNNEEIQISQSSTINYKSIAKSPEKHVVNIEDDITITCKEGTKLKIFKHSLVDTKTNKLVRGKVDLEVTEYYKLSDIILGDLTTTSYGDLLETGGMLYIKATKNGRDLNLKPDKPIEISFPKKKNKEGMQLFNGEETENGVNWKSQLEDVIVTEEIELLEIEEEDIEVPFAVIQNAPIYPGCENGSNTQKKACMSRSIQEFVQRNFNTNLAIGLGLKGRQKINIVFKIDKEGLVTSIASRAPHPTLEMEAERVIKLLPQMQPGRQRGRAVIVPYSLPILFQVGDGATTISRNNNSQNIIVSRDSVKVNVDELEDRIENSDASKVSNSELNWYVFRSLNLGWINCDRFIRSGKPKTKLKLKIKNSEGADVKLVFKSMSSVLRGRKKTYGIYDFGTVPKDEDIVLIVIKKLEDKFHLAIAESKTDIVSELELDFKPLTLPEIKAKIESLNLDF